MKKLFLLAAAALFAFSSCVKENDKPADQLPNVPAKLKLSFNVPDTKAIDDNEDGKELNDLTLFVLNSANEIIKSFYVDCNAVGFSWTTKEFDITTSAVNLVGIGNIGEDLTLASKKFNNFVLTPYNLTGLRAEMGNLEDIVFPDAVWMSGMTSSAITYDVTDPDNATAAATLDLYLIPAKLDITVTDNRDGIDATAAGVGGTWVIKDVSVLYSAQYTHYVKGAGATGGFVPSKAALDAKSYKYFYVGTPYYDWDSADTFETVVDKDYANLSKSWTSTAKGDKLEQTFYVLPIGTNGIDGSTPIIAKNTIVSIMLENADGDKSYFATTFSAQDADVKQYVQSGHQYEINITLKGNATTGGNPDPEEVVTNAALTVTVTPKGWAPVNPISKEFGS